MKHALGCALACAFVVGCAAEADETAETDESELIGDSAAEILNGFAGEGVQVGVSDAEEPCGFHVPSGSGDPVLLWSYTSTAEEEQIEMAYARDFRVAMLSRKMTSTRRFGGSFLFPCSWSGGDCDEKKVVVSYDSQKRITSIRTEFNGEVDHICTIDLD